MARGWNVDLVDDEKEQLRREVGKRALGILRNGSAKNPQQAYHVTPGGSSHWG